MNNENDYHFIIKHSIPIYMFILASFLKLKPHVKPNDYDYDFDFPIKDSDRPSKSTES